jgi:hypothetical protein
MSNRSPRSSVDRGTVLPIVLVIVIVLGAVVLATAKYATSTLRYGQVVESRADRLSAAEGGMRDIIDRITNSQLPLCSTAAGVGGVDVELPDLSGADVTVRCQQIGGQLADITSWAVVITGEGVPDGQGLTTQSGGQKVFGGTTYVARTELLGLGKQLLIEQGDLWYSDAGCSAGGEFMGPPAADVVFDSAIRGLWCTNRPWQYSGGQPTGLFGAPTIPTLPTAAPAPFQDVAGGCRVFFPGRYTSPPDWNDAPHGGPNYMMSGDYVFAIPGSGTITIDKAIVTAGRQGAGGDEQQIDNDECDAVRDADTGTGASFYLDGNSHFEISNQAALEILRRQQGDNYVSIQTLPTYTHTYPGVVLSTKSGNNSEMSIHGMIWAPYSTVELGNVTNSVVAQIIGGAVVAAMHVQSSASADGLLISVQGAPTSDKWALTSTATNSGGTTRVRVIAQVRHSSTDAGQTLWELAQNSWRVCEASGC